MALAVDHEPGFPDGQWYGTMSGSVDIGFGSGAHGGSSGAGEFSLTVEGGTVAEGRFDATAQGRSEAAGTAGAVKAEGTLTSSGIMAGDAQFVTMRMLSGEVNGTVTVDGFSQGMSMPLGEGSYTVIITSANCDVVVGDAVAHLAGVVEGAGATLNFADISWVAMRMPRDAEYDGGASFGTAVETLEADAAAILAGAGSGSLDVDALLRVLARAARIGESLTRHEDCGVGATDSHLSVLARVVQRFLEFVAANPGAVGDLELQVAIEAGIAAGVLGAGAPFRSTGLEARLRGALGGKLDAVIASGDTIAIMRLGATAEMMGWRTEAARAARALSSGGGG